MKVRWIRLTRLEDRETIFRKKQSVYPRYVPIPKANQASNLDLTGFDSWSGSWKEWYKRGYSFVPFKLKKLKGALMVSY
jgi:hypothetical protein